MNRSLNNNHYNGNRNDALVPLSTYIFIGKLISILIENSIDAVTRRTKSFATIGRVELWNLELAVFDGGEIVKRRNRLALERYDFLFSK